MKTIHYLRTILLLGLVLPVSGYSNSSAGNFPSLQAVNPAGQFPPLTSQYKPIYPSQYKPVFPSQSYQAYPYSAYNTGTPWMQRPVQRPFYGNPYQSAYQPYPQMNYNTPDYRFSNMSPFGNSFSPNSFMNNNNGFPTPWSNIGSNSNMWNPWKNGNNSSMPFFPGQKSNSNEKKAWGDERNIWPDFYTDFTGDFWDQGTNGPYDMGRMPGGWRAPSLSSPDPVTVGDAVVNQFPPMMEEMGNMMDFSN